MRASLADDGVFAFDLNTAGGLRAWSGESFHDGENVTMFKRGMFIPEEGRAYMEIVGFSREIGRAHV